MMDQIHLMAITPQQIREAIGDDRVKVVRGSRKVFRARQARERRGLQPDSDLEDNLVPGAAAEAAVGGMPKYNYRQPPVMADGGSQMEPADITHYYDPPEVLQSLNLRILTGRPRDINEGLVRPENSMGNLQQRGSEFSVASQTHLNSRRGCCLGDLCRSLFQKPSLLPKEDSSEDVSLEHEPQERNEEWLSPTSSEKSQDNMQAAWELNQLQHPPPPGRLKPQCYEVMRTMLPFFWFLKLGGRWPLESYVEDRLTRFRLNRLSGNFIVFVFTTVLLLTCTVQGVVNTFRMIASSAHTKTYTEVAEKAQFNKYWPYAFATFLYSGYASLWSLAAIYDDGRFLADFMSRWNFGVHAINYNPLESVRWELGWSLGWLIFYTASILVFYVFDLIPAVTGTADLLGILIFRSYASEDRLSASTHLHAVRICGLWFHLYSVYAARAVTLWMILYCKFLENLARRWNLRFCYVFGMLGRLEDKDRYITYHTVIPLTKLFAEHNFITGMSRYTGKIFSIGLWSYFLLKGIEMIMFAYRLVAVFIFPEPPPIKGHESVMCPNHRPNCEAVKFQDEIVYVFMSIFYLTCQSIVGWFMTSESIVASGQAIMSGFNFVRRYGLPRCKNAKERRFIQSLNFTYAPTTDYWVNPGFAINRKFIFEMFSWVFVFVTLMMAFSPFQLETEVVTSCGEPINGTITCYQISVNRAGRAKLVKEAEKVGTKMKYYERKSHSVPGKGSTDPLTTPPPAIPTTTTLPTSVLNIEPECPNEPKEALDYYCCPRNSTVWGGRSTTYVPKACDPTGKPSHAFVQGTLELHCHNAKIWKSNPFAKYLASSTNCDGKVMGPETDECNNPVIRDKVGIPPRKKPVLMHLSNTATFKAFKLVVCCCYDYHWYKQLATVSVENNYCNTVSHGQSYHCQKSCRNLALQDIPHAVLIYPHVFPAGPAANLQLDGGLPSSYVPAIDSALAALSSMTEAEKDRMRTYFEAKYAC